MNPVNCQSLAALGRHIETPISLRLAPDASGGNGENSKNGENGNYGEGYAGVLVLNSILRLLPGKRLVALTEWLGKPAIAKLFFQPGNWQRHIQREQQGLDLLIDAGLYVPQQLRCAEMVEGHGAVLISDYLNQADSLEQLSREAQTDQQYLAAVGAVVKVIGECHKHGIWQQDIHPDNFLLTSDRVYCIDGASVNKIDKPGPLSESACLENIILFLAQFPCDKDRFLPELFSNYQQSRADTVIHISWELLRERIHAARKKRLDNYEKKLFRSTTDHICRHSATQFVVYKRAIESVQLQKFICDPDSYISSGHIIKAGNSSTVARITIAEQTYVVKRYNIKSPWHGLKRMFRPSRAHNSWLHGSVLQMLGIATAAPLLCLERRWCWWLRSKAYFMCEDLVGDTVAEQLLSPQTELLTSVLDAYQNLFAAMRSYRISHGDMKATNFIYAGGILYVLDLDAMQRHTSNSRFNKQFRKDLMRFRQNWITNPAIDQKTQNLVADIQTKSN